MLFNNEGVYPLNALITQVLVNIVVKGDFFFTFYMEYNHGKPCKNPDHFLLPACTLSCELSWAEGMDQQLIVLTADPEDLGSVLSPQNS